MKIIWSPLAIERLEEISDFISYDKPASAEKWVESIFKKVDLLKSNPQIGRVVPEIETPTIRELIFNNYRIIYRTAKDSIQILTIRNFRQLLSIEDIK